MASVKGRHEARKRVCHRARTLSSAPLRSSTTAFRDNSTSVPNRGASPSLVRVSGIDHTGPVQGRTERGRAPAEAHEGPRVRSTVPSRSGPNDWRGQNDVGRREGRPKGDEMMPDRSDRGPPPSVILYTRRPATSFLRVSTHINTRYVYTGMTPAFVAVFALPIGSPLTMSDAVTFCSFRITGRAAKRFCDPSRERVYLVLLTAVYGYARFSLRSRRRVPNNQSFKAYHVSRYLVNYGRKLSTFRVNVTPDTQARDPTTYTYGLARNPVMYHPLARMQAVEEKTRKKEAPSGIDVPRINNCLVPGKGERGWEEKRSRGRRYARIATEFRHRIAVKSRCNCDVVR
ncbi:hypothetical protein DBV15_02984 [Temnothorax longispinosus]|uniref:Uncharacterized protein n=1 Tax=Temnothorax longispinosus TaxID=300112 RepID=A0A4S2KCM5_9HYME|nr:hypothetical protein DBV15_02984 [Temnothorax longispinosus]